MSFPVTVFILCVALLVVEWRLQSRIVRLVTVILAAGGLYLLHPNVHMAARAAMSVPPAERVNRIGDRQLGDYEIGVMTTRREVYAHIELHEPTRSILEMTVLWLSISAAFRRRPLFENRKTAHARPEKGPA